jgi:hypothetical protein
MQSILLAVDREELLRAIALLGTTRKRRFSSVVPVWLKHDPAECQLHIQEDGGAVIASVPAEGDWPPMGATVDLYLLRRAVQRGEGTLVRLRALGDAVVLEGEGWNVRLDLLEFGPPEPPLPPLPLFDR